MTPMAQAEMQPLTYEEVEIGADIPSWSLDYTLPVMVRWCAAVETWRRDHYDFEYAVNELGLPNAVGSGYWTQACFYKLLYQWVGDEGWVWKVSHQLRGHLLPHHVFTFSGRVVGKSVEDGLGYVDLDLALSQEDDTVLSPGHATVVVPLRGGKAVPYPFPRPR
jgi:acyl dehydratase